MYNFQYRYIFIVIFLHVQIGYHKIFTIHIKIIVFWIEWVLYKYIEKMIKLSLGVLTHYVPDLVFRKDVLCIYSILINLYELHDYAHP